MVAGYSEDIMKRLLCILALCAVVSCVREPIEGGAEGGTALSKIVSPTSEPVAGMLLVRLADAGSAEELEMVAGLAVKTTPIFRASNHSELNRWFLLTFDKDADVNMVARAVAEQSCVERVEFERVFKPAKCEHKPFTGEATRATTMPMNDTYLASQWHYNNDGSLGNYCTAGADINLFNAWKYTTGDKRIIVAVIDGGVMTTHPDLADNLWVNEAEKNGKAGVDDDGNGYVDDVHGYNFCADKGAITADSHGTHVAGTISAVNNNGVGVSGIAGGSGKGDGVRIMSLQIFEGEEGCYSYQLAEAFRYAADNGAVLTNNSWGYEPYAYTSDSEYERNDSVIKAAIDYFEQNARLEGVVDGGLAIFAAGNETEPVATYPGAYYKSISVSAMSANYLTTYYTNYGDGVNICAPGGDYYYGEEMTVLSTSSERLANYYEWFQGTSMATPHVTGCAALALSYAAQRGYKLTADELRNLILTSVHDINQYQSGKRPMYNYYKDRWESTNISSYSGKLGSGYIDAHLLLMQLDGTPCLYATAGEESEHSLVEFFGYGAKDLSFKQISISNDVKTTLGIESEPSVTNGMLKIKCTKPGVGRIKLSALVGGNAVGGGNSMGGMLVEREFEIVVRGSVAANGGWL